MPLVMQHATAVQLGHLETLANRMLDKARNGETFEDEDREFHLTLYGPLKNTFLTRLVELFWEVFHRLNGSAGLPHWSMEQTALDHLKILEAMRSGQPQQAQEALRAHFGQINERLSEPSEPPVSVADIETTEPADTPY